MPALQSLAESKLFQISAVVTQADKPAGRGQKLQASAVKQEALKYDIPVFQPKSLKSITLEDAEEKRLHGSAQNSELVDFLNSIAPIDIFVCVAYGKIIPPALLEFAEAGMVNIHPSLLPRWRGAAPLQRALFAGDTETGVSIMDIDEGLDSGPVYLIESFPIAEDETLGTLHEKTALLGAELLLKALPRILEGSLQAKAQSEEGLTYAEKWEKEDCIISWEEPAATTLNRIRASDPIPGAKASLEGELVKIFRAKAVQNQNYQDHRPGEIVEANKGELVVACGDSQYIAIEELQFSGKKRLPVVEALRGRKISVGQVFS